MKKYVVGLGNPGEEYKNSRHNAGFLVADLLAKKLNLSWKFDKKFNAEIAREAGGNIVLVKPHTFMNDSGTCVRAVLSYEKDTSLSKGPEASFEQLFVVYDDLDIQLGQYKKQFATHPKIHNGVNSVIQALHSDLFWNVRVGTDTREGDRVSSSKDFVLQHITAEERARLAQVLENVVQEVHDSIVSS